MSTLEWQFRSNTKDNMWQHADDDLIQGGFTDGSNPYTCLISVQLNSVCKLCVYVFYVHLNPL